MEYTQSKGNLVELQCISKFIELGYECSIPYGNSAKYDFIADVNGQLLRIQCKSASHPTDKSTGLPDLNAIQFSCAAQTTNTQKTTRHLYDKTQIDYFATVFNNQVYLIPVEECSTHKTLRFIPPKNNNPNYNDAKKYEIENFIPCSENLKQSKQEFDNRHNLKNENNKQIYCKKCGAEFTIYSKSGLCSKCKSFQSRRVERPSREELKNLIRNFSFLEIGRIYKVSDASIRKWCKAEGLPTKKTEIKNFSDEDWINI